MSGPKDSLAELIVGAGLLALVISGVLMCAGPAGLKTGLSSWQASAYGSDWLVVQYAQSGCTIATWELRDEAIKNEGDSDGIYFVSEGGAVVHLSGHYVYVQSPTPKEAAQLLGLGPCGGAR